MKETFNKSSMLLRRELGSIKAIEPDEQLSPVEARSKAADIEVFYMNHFEKELQRFINEQLLFMGTMAKDEGQFIFGRGTINGFLLIEDWFKKQGELSRIKPDKEQKLNPERPFDLEE